MNVSEFANDEVRIIHGIVGLMHTPRIVTGKVSGSGKTISVELEGGDSYRLDTEKIMSGSGDYRDSRYFELYTYENMEKNQRANRAPGPQAGTDGVSDREDLPEPTHEPRA